MYAEIRALMAQQHGLITRRQAISAGLSAATVDELVRRGTWRTIRRGAYVESAVWDALDDRTGRPLLVARAVTLTAAKAHAWSHDTAGLALGLALLTAKNSLTHVTRPDVRGDRTTRGVKHHGAAFIEAEVEEVDGIRVLGMARSAVDVAREHGLAHGLAPYVVPKRCPRVA
ncbi:type IV toxin-antitoxin system AbiEi family antitoxin domain-containing protein [Nocardioides sp.]|uniref:type IV toxin-antitoxin system AbiEi family antitoxin domain-containing protein n=1 Tax=Nocardioides sp. TaxID=35761 RepID=UPI002B77BB97|nr:type IV toxin-antitoxin system AbiEi family antitoxin domain-containing protein [Nocardioides sp.]HSX68204.1 type IV toxin-antitoxin system AbiEi family antitoxin domain-containing protein [Nocardioides sp.]